MISIARIYLVLFILAISGVYPKWHTYDNRAGYFVRRISAIRRVNVLVKELWGIRLKTHGSNLYHPEIINN